MPPREKYTDTYRLINVHAVNGDLEGIEYLRNADGHLVDGIFFFAKRYGRSEFEYRGRQYEILRNRNLTYTVKRVMTDDEKLANALR